MRFFSQKEIKIFLIVILVGSVVAVTVTLMVTVFFAPPVVPEVESRSGRKKIEMDIDETELMIPEEFRSIWKEELYQYRPQMNQWTEEQIDSYWMDPKELLLEYYEEQNKKLLERILEEVP